MAGGARVSGVAATAAMLLTGLVPGAVAQAPCIDPEGRRVDLAEPAFTNPTNLTHRLFPVGTAGQTIQLGDEAGEPVRLEITALPGTRTIRWNGRDVQARVSHFVAYTGGRIAEVALDFFAQDDAGNVWYFGEEVENYEDGVVANHDGTWLAGRDGPPGMIMPARPAVGDVYRPENIPGLVFEEVTVTATGRTVRGPSGRVGGAVYIKECLMDGTVEEKVFAPGYGEFESRVAAEREHVKLALAVPRDAAGGSVPRSLESIDAAAGRLFEHRNDRQEVRRLVRSIDRSWDAYQRTPGIPPLLAKQMDAATDALEEAAGSGDAGEVGQAAIDVAFAGLDLQLRHRPAPGVDRDRVAVWMRQLRLDRQTGDAGDVAGDRAAIAAIEGRLR